MQNKTATGIKASDVDISLSHYPSPTIHGLANLYVHLATSDNTRKAYQSDIRHYETWGGCLPATPAMIAHYLEAHAKQLNPRTLARRLIALRHWHNYQNFSDPTAHSSLQKIMKGILRVHGSPREKAHALTPDELTKIIKRLDIDHSLAAMRDAALLQIGFFGALRRSELVAIHYEHISWNKAGIEILLPTSKTDQTHQGQYCAIPYGNHILCPVRALKHWLTQAKIHTGPIFRRITSGSYIGDQALTPLSINHILKKRAQDAGIKTSTSLSSHSLRRGLATSAARASAPLHAIMQAGRWKHTNTVMEYIDASKRFTENAAASVLQTVKINNAE